MPFEWSADSKVRWVCSARNSCERWGGEAAMLAPVSCLPVTRPAVATRRGVWLLVSQAPGQRLLAGVQSFAFPATAG